MVVPVSIGVFLINKYFELGKRPIAWMEFADVELADELAAGKKVLIFFRADWSNTQSKNLQVLESPEIRRLLHSTGFTAVFSEMALPSGETHPLQKRHGFCNMMVFDPRQPDLPSTLPHGVIYNKATIVEALEKGSDFDISKNLNQATTVRSPKRKKPAA